MSVYHAPNVSFSDHLCSVFKFNNHCSKSVHSKLLKTKNLSTLDFLVNTNYKNYFYYGLIVFISMQYIKTSP